MLTFYCAEDVGLLNEKITQFKKENTEYSHLKNCSIEEISNALFQISLFEDNRLFLIEEYEGDLKDLTNLMKQVDLSSVDLFITYQQFKKKVVPVALIKLISNKDFQLLKLTLSTKKTYINNVCKSLGLIISYEQKEMLYQRLPRISSVINQFLENLELYSDNGKNALTNEVIIYFLETIDNDSSVFDFFQKFFSRNKSVWLSFFDQKTKSEEDLAMFIRAFIFKLCEFSNYVSMRRKFNRYEIAKATGKPDFIFINLENIYAEHQKNIFKYINTFTINFYFFLYKEIEFVYKNAFFLKHFFLTNSIDLYD